MGNEGPGGPTDESAGNGAGIVDASEREGALLRLLARHERSLRRTARRYSLCADDAEDALQRALEVALTKAPVATDRELLRWTQTVTKHEALAVRRQRERLLDGTPGGGEEGGDPLDLLASELLEPGERAERTERVARSCEALTSLKPQELRALTLKAEGYSYAEIQELTGWTYTKVNRCMAEGRKRFLTVFDQIEGGDRCEELADDLSLLCDGELGPERALKVRRHLRGCAHCRARVGAFRGLPRRVLELTPPVLPLASTWWMRLQEAVYGGASERLIGSTVKAQQLLELAGAKKATAVAAASAAAVAGGGAAITDAVHGVDDGRAAVERAAPEAGSEPAAATGDPAAPTPDALMAPGASDGEPLAPPPQSAEQRPSGPEAEFGSPGGGGEFGGPSPSGSSASSSPEGGEFGAPAASSTSPATQGGSGGSSGSAAAEFGGGGGGGGGEFGP